MARALQCDAGRVGQWRGTSRPGGLLPAPQGPRRPAPPRGAALLGLFYIVSKSRQYWVSFNIAQYSISVYGIGFFVYAICNDNDCLHISRPCSFRLYHWQCRLWNPIRPQGHSHRSLTWNSPPLVPNPDIEFQTHAVMMLTVPLSGLEQQQDNRPLSLCPHYFFEMKVWGFFDD